MAGTTTYYGISYPTSTDYVKDGASAMQTIATGFDSAVAIPTYNNQTGTSYTFVLADTGKTVTSDNASAVTFTIPPQASVAWANNTTLTVRNLGAGVVTIAGGAGVTVTNTAQTVAQYGEVKLIRTASNAWTVVPASGGTSGLTLISSTTIGTGVSSVTVSNAFSSTYANYRVLIGGVTFSSTTNIRFQFGSATTAHYGSQYYDSFGGGATGTDRVNNGSSILVGVTGTLNDTFTSFDVFSPNLAQYSGLAGTYQGGGYSGWFAGLQGSSTQFTAFNIVAGSGTMTGGTIRVYGYQNS